MPKNSKKMIKEIHSESHGCKLAKCIKEETMRTFNNNRAYQLWLKFHDKRCDCLKIKPDVLLTSTAEEVRKFGSNGNLYKSKTEFARICKENM